MRFEFQGQQISIEFYRDHYPVTPGNSAVAVESTYPGTWVFLKIVNDEQHPRDWNCLVSGFAGVAVDRNDVPLDKFSKEAGRMAALKSLTRNIDDLYETERHTASLLKHLVWTTYQNRSQK